MDNGGFGGWERGTDRLPPSAAETNATVSHFTNIWKSGRAAMAAAANRLLTATDGEGGTGRLGRRSVQLSMVSYRWNRPR